MRRGIRNCILFYKEQTREQRARGSAALRLCLALLPVVTMWCVAEAMYSNCERKFFRHESVCTLRKYQTFALLNCYCNRNAIIAIISIIAILKHCTIAMEFGEKSAIAIVGIADVTSTY